MKILTKLRNSFKRKKKKPIEEKIPDGLQQRIKTPGDRIDCSLEKWTKYTIMFYNSPRFQRYINANVTPTS